MEQQLNYYFMIVVLAQRQVSLLPWRELLSVIPFLGPVNTQSLHTYFRHGSCLGAFQISILETKMDAHD
jgi:hypothetical protein